MDLDEQLKAAAPAVTTRTPQLHAELDALVAASEAAQPRRRRRVRAALIGGVVAGALGIGTVASATGILPAWTKWTTSSGQTCEIQVHADPLKPGDGEPISATFTQAERDAALAAAREFLTGVDYAKIDRDEVIAQWQAVEAEVRAAQPDPAERQPKLEGDELEVHAVTWSIVGEMRADLAAQGLDIRATSVGSSSSGCPL